MAPPIGSPLALADAGAAAVDIAELRTLPAPEGGPDRLCAVSAGGWHLVSVDAAGWRTAPVWTPYARTSSGNIRRRRRPR